MGPGKGPPEVGGGHLQCGSWWRRHANQLRVYRDGDETGSGLHEDSGLTSDFTEESTARFFT